MLEAKKYLILTRSSNVTATFHYFRSYANSNFNYKPFGLSVSYKILIYKRTYSKHLVKMEIIN